MKVEKCASDILLLGVRNASTDISDTRGGKLLDELFSGLLREIEFGAIHSITCRGTEVHSYRLQDLATFCVHLNDN